MNKYFGLLWTTAFVACNLCIPPIGHQEDADGNYNKAIKSCQLHSSCDLDDFIIGSILGRGNFGLVREALHKQSNKRVAIKFQQHQSPEWFLFIRNEECVLHELSLPEPFPFIVQHYGTMVLTNGTVGYVMEFVEGHNMRSIVKGHIKGMQVTNLNLQKIMAQLMVTLQFIHSKNIVMADMTADNIMVTKGGDIKMIDFGLAIKTFEDGQVLKKPQWISYGVLPEFGNRPATDWYAYGLVLYEVLNGKGPFEQLKGAHFFKSHLVRGQFCPNSFDDLTCNFIKQFSATSWDLIWGTTEETRQLIRQHPWFDEFDWVDIQAVCNHFGL